MALSRTPTLERRSVAMPTPNVPEPMESQVARAYARRHPFASESFTDAILGAIVLDVVLLLLGVVSRGSVRELATMMVLDVALLLLWVPIRRWIYRPPS
jgi:hypothetical protein